MLGHVVFVVVMGALLVDAMTVQNTQSSPCEHGAKCHGQEQVSRAGNMIFCCPDPNTGIEVSSSSVNGMTSYSCQCVSKEKLQEQAHEARVEAEEVAEEVREKILRQQEEIFEQQERLMAGMHRKINRDLL